MADIDPCQPIWFEPNRVWRCYTGGLLLDQFLGDDQPSDGHFPEDWLASTVLAVNDERSQGPSEGLSKIKGTDIPFKDLLASNATRYLGKAAEAGELSILCKYLDSAVRLPIQCHPDVAFAREHYGSGHGKTEAWAILGTRKIGGEDPYLLMGFKPGIDAEAFKGAVLQQDVKAMESMLHRVPAKAGDVWLIPGRLPHAIGPGVFLLEVQEPSDWVVQPEAKCADTCLTEADMWGPLTPEVGLKCFSYEGVALHELEAKTLMKPATTIQTGGGQVKQIIGKAQTDRFGIDLIEVEASIDVEMDAPYAVQVVVDGAGTMRTHGQTHSIKSGEVCFLPNGIRNVVYNSETNPLSIYLCKPALP